MKDSKLETVTCIECRMDFPRESLEDPTTESRSYAENNKFVFCSIACEQSHFTYNGTIMF